MNKEFISKHWYAYAYEQFETETNDVKFLLNVLRENTDKRPQNILEVACGGGRISIPLAEAGHQVCGFDADEFMLLRCYRKMKGIPNITCYKADAVSSDWGLGYDVVVMAGNILINIESDLNYNEAQQLFIQKAYAALRPGGHLFLDYDQHSEASALKIFNNLRERHGSDYVDELGTRGSDKIFGNIYDPITRICTWTGHRYLICNNGEHIIESSTGHKHIPMLKQVFGWLTNAGFIIEKTYQNYSNEPLDEQHEDYVRATIWAKK